MAHATLMYKERDPADHPANKSHARYGPALLSAKV